MSNEYCAYFRRVTASSVRTCALQIHNSIRIPLQNDEMILITIYDLLLFCLLFAESDISVLCIIIFYVKYSLVDSFQNVQSNKNNWNNLSCDSNIRSHKRFFLNILSIRSRKDQTCPLFH